MAFFSLAKPVLAALLAVIILTFAVTASTVIIWRQLPAEGVKLHGNIDVGIDLLGTRNDVLLILGGALVVVIANLVLAAWLQNREKLAAQFLLGTTVIFLAGINGALWFIFFLNQPQ